MNDPDFIFFKQLSESFGPSGFEREPLNLLKNYIKPYADELETDKLGSLLFTMNGDAEHPRIAVPGHIDEIGFITTGFTDAFIRFVNLGGWFDQILLGQRVRIRSTKGDLLGVIAGKPPHLISPEDRKKVVNMKEMYIDIGCQNKEELEQLGIRLGDPIVPVSKCSLLHDNKTAMGKAFDDRVGVFVAALACKKLKEEKISHPNTVIGAATTMEEVGARGARTMAHVSNPDIAIICEVEISGDIPDTRPGAAPGKMGKGVAILTYDRSMIPNPALKEFVINTAKECKIPYQLSLTATGGTDGGAIHLSRKGCPSIVLGVPTRHIHSPVSFFALSDFDAAVQLVIELIKKLDLNTVQSFTEF
ncbi:MAG: M42 family metallopeptidase [Candidatus Helarchaeota archaeon]|nr:M42 family metallopeptidase [Candidatus Helarchaeota archaeon]